MTRIIRRTETTLHVITTGPRLLGWGLIVAGLVGFWFLAIRYQIECSKDDRDAVSCTILASRFGVSPSRRVVDSVTGARVQDKKPRRRHRGGESGTVVVGKVYRVVLETPDGEFPVSRSFDNRKTRHQQLARAINDFITDPQQRNRQLVLPWNPWLLSLLAASLVGAGLLRAGTSRIRIDKPCNRMEIVRAMPFWNQRTELRLDEVREFRLLAKEKFKSTVYCTGVLLGNGAELPLTHLWSSSAERHRELAAALERFRSEPVPPPAAR